MPNYRAGNPMPPQTIKTKKGMKKKEEQAPKKKCPCPKKRKKPMGIKKKTISY